MTAVTLEHHDVSYDAIKEKSKDASISMMRKNKSILVWLDSIEKDLKNIIGHRGISLLYLICGYEKHLDTNTDLDELDFIKGRQVLRC